MCDKDKASVDYFNRHLDLMRELGQSTEYDYIESVEDFFRKLQGEG